MSDSSLVFYNMATIVPLFLLHCRLRDRVTVKTGPRHIVRETEDGTFQMTIKSAVRSDSGIYTCKIINEYGTKQCEGKLEVKGTLLFESTGVCCSEIQILDLEFIVHGDAGLLSNETR